MAKIPTIEDTKRAILDVISSYKVRPNEIFPIVQISVKLQERGFRNTDIDPALEQMVNDGWLLPSNGPHWTITESGFAQL